MNKFIILPNLTKDNDLAITNRMKDWLEAHGKEVRIVAKEYVLGAESSLEVSSFYDWADCVIVLGGDGTILYAARQMAWTKLPMLGVNLGNLGFLAEVEEKDALAILQKINEGEYSIQKRMMLQVTMGAKGQRDASVALNDMVIARTSISRMMKYSIYVNGGHVNDYSADGLIISTPTGSTAYNLSAGGPILDPGNEMMVITPICPHTLMARSIVLSKNDHVRISLKDNRENWKKDITLTIDGQESYPIDQDEDIIVTKSAHSARLITCHKNGFYGILKKKLGNR